MNHVQTGIYHVQPIYKQVYTHTYCFSIYCCVHTCLELCHDMYIPGTYIKCTKLYVFARILENQKVTCWRIEPKTSCIGSSCLNHCASSVDVKCFTVRVYVYCSTWRKSQRLERWLVAVQLTGFQVTVVRIPDVLGPHQIGG